MSRSLLFLARNNLRSRSMPVLRSLEDTNTCSIRGIAFFARSPRTELSVGGVRQPKTVSDSSPQISSNLALSFNAVSASMKTRPTP